MDASHIRQVADLCTTFLRDSLDADWTADVPDLDMSPTGVVAHVAEGCLWYAIDLAAGGNDLEPVEHRVKTDGTPADVIDTLAAYTTVLASVVELAPPSARGFHPMGSADPSGFAAMACDEMLIHTSDVALGLGVDFEPSPALAELVLRRLFPWVAVDPEPWPLLLWANGRVALADRPRLSGWAWHCAPLDEWDGQPR